MFSAKASAVVFKALVSTNFSINPISSSLVKPANSLSLGWQVTFLAMLKPEVNESKDTEDTPRNMIQLIADYGSDIAGLYRSQLREIERVVLEKKY